MRCWPMTARASACFARSSSIWPPAGCPSEEDQFQAYKRVALAMKGKRVIVRTLDIGADKQAGRFHLNREENPALGLRAIRICLNHPEVFRTQLRALYRASACGKIAIMFPMIGQRVGGEGVPPGLPAGDG